MAVIIQDSSKNVILSSAAHPVPNTLHVIHQTSSCVGCFVG